MRRGSRAGAATRARRAAAPLPPAADGREPSPGGDREDPTAAAPAATPFHGGSSVALANGRRGAAWTIPTMTDSRNHAGRPRIVADHRGSAGERGQPAGQRDRARGHGRRDERHDAEVHDRRHDREPPERQQHDRQRRGLGDERDAEALGEPAREPAAPSPQATPERRRPGEHPGGRER